MKNKYIVICASGPSLTLDDCQVVISSGIKIIAVNSTWQVVPECNYIYSGDYLWWKVNYNQISSKAERWSCNVKACHHYNLNIYEPDYRGSYNSGQRAILFAASLGVEKIILLGFDCSLQSGVHWHGKHLQTGNPGENCIRLWHYHFQMVSKHLNNKVEIINCSRNTELTCFKRMFLQDVL